MKEILIVTLILDHPAFNYQPLGDYLNTFDQIDAIAPTATNKSLFLHTDIPEKEIRAAIQKLLGPNDYCSIDCYDIEDGPAQITAAARALVAWVEKDGTGNHPA